MSSDPLFYDRVLETSSTTGTGAYTLEGAVLGFQSFGVVGNANSCYYCAADVDANGNPLGGWEVGVGTYTISGTTLSRDSILASSNSGAAVSWAIGTRRVFLVVPASYQAVPQITSFASSLHTHQNAAGGGQLTLGAVAASTAAIPFGAGGGLSESAADFYWNDANKRLALRVPTGTTPVATVDAWSTTSPFIGTRVGNSTNSNQITARKARGASLASLTKVLSGDGIGGFAAQGYEEVTPGFKQSATVQFVALEDFTNTAIGTRILFGCAPLSSTSVNTILQADWANGVAANTLLNLSSASAGQIQFPSTQNPSTNANTLDDYKEGTWTPTDASGAGLSLTVAGTPWYVKVGQLVTASFQVAFPVTGSGADALIGGLPFTIANLSNVAGSVGLATVATGMNVLGVVNATSLQLRNPAGGARYTNAQLSATQLAVTISYRAEA